MTSKTQVVHGITFTLEAGRRYVASRPMAALYRTVYPIHIVDADAGPHAPVIIPNETDGYSIEEANAFLAEWNNGAMSFDGRVW